MVIAPAPCLRHDELAARLRELAARYPGAPRARVRGPLGGGARDPARRRSAAARGACCCGRRCTATSPPRRRRCSTSSRPARSARTRRAAADPRAADAARGADAQSRRRRALRAPQRAGDRHQPRRAASSRRPRGGCSRRCATATSPSSASTCTTRTGARPWARRACWRTIALLAVAGDPQGTLTPGRARAKRVCSRDRARRSTPFVPGGIARYDEDWSPRAFGDNLTAWGTPVVLIESGGLPPGRLAHRPHAAQLRGAAERAPRPGARTTWRTRTPRSTSGSPRNSDGRATSTSSCAAAASCQPPAAEPYRADVAFDVLDDDPARAACPDPRAAGPSRIREVGDARLLAAARRRDVADAHRDARARRVGARAGGEPWLAPAERSTP